MKHTILFLAANPSGIASRTLYGEMREIQGELERSGFRDHFEFVTRWAYNPDDLFRTLHEFQPTVVHFSGHGSHGNQDGLFLLSEHGDVQAISPTWLARVFSVAGTSVTLVVLSACYSENVAQALLGRGHVNCVVGTKSSIGDKAARRFAVAFYAALSARESVMAAYQQGIDALSLWWPRDIVLPQLMVHPRIDAERLTLASDGPPDRTRGLEASRLRSYLDLSLGSLKRFRGQTRDDRGARTAAAPTIYMNVWFPEHEGSEVTLTVGVATRIWVNLAHGPRAGTFTSKRVSDDAAQRFYEVDHVDVIVICPGADVWPLRARLPLPPDADATASFEITPRRAGQLELLVVLLIDGESIHQTTASILASAPAGAATEAPP